GVPCGRRGRRHPSDLHGVAPGRGCSTDHRSPTPVGTCGGRSHRTPQRTVVPACGVRGVRGSGSGRGNAVPVGGRLARPVVDRRGDDRGGVVTGRDHATHPGPSIPRPVGTGQCLGDRSGADRGGAACPIV